MSKREARKFPSGCDVRPLSRGVLKSLGRNASSFLRDLDRGLGVPTRWLPLRELKWGVRDRVLGVGDCQASLGEVRRSVTGEDGETTRGGSADLLLDLEMGIDT